MFELSHFLFESLLNVRKTAANVKSVTCFVLILHFFPVFVFFLLPVLL